MTRWARWQVYLFWLSISVAMGLTTAFVVVEALDDEWHHVAYTVPVLLLLPFCGFLYFERAKSLRSLRDGEARYRALVEEASNPIYVSDLRTRRFVSGNQRALELTGYSLSELTELHVPDVVNMGDIDVDDARRQLADGVVLHLQAKIIHKDGHEIPIECSVTRISGDLVQSIVRPIAERLEAEAALRRSEQVFRAVSEMTSDYAFSMKINPDGSLTPEWFTAGYERVTGYTVEESHTKGGWEVLAHPDDLPMMRESLMKALVEGGSVVAEFRIVNRSGDIRHLKTWSRFERPEPNAAPDRIIGAVSDVTEQKLLQENLAESERRFRNVYERLPIGIYRRERQGPALDANPTCVEMFGYPDEKTFREQDPREYYVDPADRDRWIDVLDEYGVVRNFDVRYKRYDGTAFWGRNTARLVRDESTGTALIEGAIVDVTEEKKLDEELRATVRDLRRADAERRRLLTHLVKAKEDERNRVASDIHDDSVQIMTAIAIDLERLSRKAPDPSSRAELEGLEARARDAVGRLRTMVFELRPPALDQEGVVAALRLYLEEFTIDTGIDYELKSGLEAEPQKPTRVILYRIAQEALMNVRKHADASCVVVQLAREGSGIAMTITDDGRGFDVSAVELESPGHIGLAEMRERAEIGGGRFEISSGVGAGTSVSVWVPELAA